MPPAPVSKPLPNAAFLVLALLAEGPAHGYQLERLVWNRGFRYWAAVKRSSIYGALKRLEASELVTSTLEEGRAAPRKVYEITTVGRDRLAAETAEHLATPDHPHSEIDLGIYALPHLPPEQALEALDAGRATLSGRLGFLRERLAWSREQGLPLVALGFERPMLALEAELAWLDRVREAIGSGELDTTALDWKRYEYRQPPEPRVPKDPPPRGMKDRAGAG